MKEDLIKPVVKERDYYECASCSINTRTKGRMCPCPRGSCDAEFVGKTIYTIVTIKTKHK